MKPQVDASRSSAEEGLEAAISACVATECNRELGQKLSKEDEKLHADFARAAKVQELGDWTSFKVSKPPKAGDVKDTVMDTRWVPTWEKAEGDKTAKARQAAKGFQDPDTAEGIVDTSGCVSLCPSQTQVISLSA